MADPFLTLQNDGVMLRSDNGSVLSEWWSPSPTITTAIGNRFQARATITDQRLDGATPSGTFGSWATLTDGLTWLLDSGGNGSGGLRFTVEIRNATSLVVEATAIITLGDLIGVVDGDFYWPMDYSEFISYSESSTSTKYNFDTALTMNIGDTISFDFYNVSSSTQLDDTFIESDDQLLSVKQGNLNQYIILGCTITVDGISIPSGDPIIANNYVNQRIVITSTINTTVSFLLNDSTAINARDMGVTNVDYNGTDGILHWDCQSEDVAAQPESNSGVNNITIQTHTIGRWANIPASTDSVSGQILHRHIDTSNLMEANFLQPSLRSDGLRNSIRYNKSNGSNNAGGGQIESFIPYQNGFTIEAIFKPDAVINRGVIDGRLSHGISPNSIAANSLWAMRFDNFDDPTIINTFPCFTLINRDSNYARATADFGNALVDLRSATATVLGNTYHFMATIRPSDNTVEFWVNGISIGSGTVPTSWYDAGGTPAKDVLDGSQQTNIFVGATNFDGSSTMEGDTTIQDIKIHLLEADQAFATRQSGTANIT